METSNPEIETTPVGYVSPVTEMVPVTEVTEVASVPETVTETVADTVTETVPDTVTETVPETVPDTVTETVTETVPDTVTEMAPDTEVSAVEEDSKKGNIEAADTPVESEEEEEQEEEEEEDGNSKTENKVHDIQPVIKNDEGLPFPIVCSASLLAFVYLLKLFFMFCAFTRMGCNRECVCFDV